MLKALVTVCDGRIAKPHREVVGARHRRRSADRSCSGSTSDLAEAIRWQSSSYREACHRCRASVAE